MPNQGLKKHPTQDPSLFAYERTDNWYYWEEQESSYPTIQGGIRGLSNHNSHFAPITGYNNWPNKLQNVSIFTYLLQPAEDARDKKFYSFVKDWYKCSCAIVYKTENADGKIIGSGALTDWTDKNGNLCVATARHNFHAFSIKNLYIRFFNYHVSSIQDNSVNQETKTLIIQEQYLDIPAIQKYSVKDGLDAGFIAIPKLQDESKFSQYAKFLPLDLSSEQALSHGTYAMFHFAGGNHHISLGEIHPSKFAKFSDEIDIQAGPGASGAAVLWHGFNKTSGSGISIYRVVKNRVPDRRLIAFTEFFYGARYHYHDPIKAPYRGNPNFFIVSEAFDVSSYEYIRWRPEAYGNSNQRPNHPSDTSFSVNQNHSNHHIIQIHDLIFLWNYLHSLEEDVEKRLHRKAKENATEKRIEITKKLKSEFLTYTSDGRSNKWKQDLQFINKEIDKFEASEKQRLYKCELLKCYQQFYELIFILSMPHNNDNDKTWFAWSWWNLFKGWDLPYRQDDPSRSNNGDFSEQIKPMNYNPRLWQCLKNSQTGLHYQIQKLKKTLPRDKEVEQALFQSLAELANVWSDKRTQQTIHPYNQEEWEEVGRKDGHPIFKLRK